jgi:two-component system response regulator TtrR
MTTQERARQALSGLTPRQRELVVLLAKGMTCQEIADAIGVALNTVKAYRTEAFSRLGLKKVAQVGVLCALAGEVTEWSGAA